MSNVTIHCFIAFCVELPLDQPYDMAQRMLELRYLEKSIKFVKQKLDLFEDQLKLIYKRDSTDVLLSTTKDALFLHASPALRDVKDMVEAANNESRNSSHCYTIAMGIIEDEVRKSYDFKIVPCLYIYTNAVQAIWQKVQPLRETHKRVWDDFDETVRSCYNFSNADECLDTKLRNIKEEHDGLEELVNSLIRKGETSYPRLKGNLETCISLISTWMENAASLVKRQGNRCTQTSGTFEHQTYN